MESIPAGWLVPIGTVAAALIAGMFSFLNLVIAKEQKVSEFRQSWIDSLREDVSKYEAAIRYIAAANVNWADQNHPDPVKFHEVMREPVDAAARAYASIVMRINPNDRNQELRSLNEEFLAKLRDAREKLRARKYEEAKAVSDELSEKMRPILKCEWEVVKGGEPLYRWTRRIALAVILSALASGGYLVYLAKNAGSGSVPAVKSTGAPKAPSP